MIFEDENDCAQHWLQIESSKVLRNDGKSLSFLFIFVWFFFFYYWKPKWDCISLSKPIPSQFRQRVHDINDEFVFSLQFFAFPNVE